MARQRDRVKERHWREHVAAWRRSGQSVRDYCSAEGLSEPSFYAWRRALSKRERRGPVQAGFGGRAALGATLPGVAPFLPVRVVAEATPAATLEVVVRGGRVVRVTPGFAANTLRAVVAALEELPC